MFPCSYEVELVSFILPIISSLRNSEGGWTETSDKCLAVGRNG